MCKIMSYAENQTNLRAAGKQIEQPLHLALIAEDNQHQLNDHSLDEEHQSEEIKIPQSEIPQSEIEQPNDMLSDEEMLEDTSSDHVNIHTTSDSPDSDTI